MAKWFHDDRVERTLTSRLDRSKERARQDMLHRVKRKHRRDTRSGRHEID